jgi:hypothetical protein
MKVTGFTGVALVAAAVVGLATATPSHAAEASDPDGARISAAGHSLKWNWTPPGRSDRYGHAETLIHAPLAQVRSHVLDFAHYKDILPDRFKTSRVVGHQADGSTDVYIQVSIMHGVLSLWDVTRFTPLKQVSPGLETLEGHMVPGKGNVEDLAVIWTMHAIDPQWTVLKFDLLLKPGLPAPQSAIDEELRDSARNAVDSIHDRAQGDGTVGPWPG